MNQCHIEKRCRLCNSSVLECILNLGRQPLANSLLSQSELDRGIVAFPMTLIRCNDCGCIQLRETISPKLLFENYLYFSSYADALVSSGRDLAEKTIARYHLGKSDLVVEIGSNDGYLLQFYDDRSIPVLGIEPANNVAQVALHKRSIPTLVEFFSLDLAMRIKQERGRAKVIHANNVLAHIADIHQVLEGMRELLAPNGVIIAEVSYVRDMVTQGCFDMIYHEHLFYYSLDSLNRIFKLHGLHIFDVEQIPNHGGSLRIYAGYLDAHRYTEALLQLHQKEKHAGILSKDYYLRFGARVEQLKVRLRDTLTELRVQGSSIVGYGAPAKATVLLNYFGIGPTIIDYIVDRNPHKQGLFLPGPNLAILHPDTIRTTTPDYLLILSWNLKEEIIEQMKYIRDWGGKFITPLPDIEMIS